MSSSTSDFVHVRAPGKINVSLKVGQVMEDGYHDVAIAYQAVSLYEDVRAYPADDFSVTFTGPVETSMLATDATNLGIKAARLLARHAKYRGGVCLEIEKHVPVAGGMGGGSADAAATLLACDTLWGTHVSKDELIHLARQLGADVPFAFTGGTAVGTGRGDVLSPALCKGTFHWVLVLADFGLSTPGVYAELDMHRAKHVRDIAPAPQAPDVSTEVLHALRNGNPIALSQVMTNDLQVAALHLEPSLKDVLELGEESGALSGIVSGSGPTVAFLAEDADAAKDLVKALTHAGHEALHVTGPVQGARVING